MADLTTILLAFFIGISVLFLVFLKWMEQRNSAKILDTISQVSQSPDPGKTGSVLQKDLPVVSHDVYISYAKDDKPVADAMCAALESENIRCWIAPRDLVRPEDSVGQMMNAIDTCTVVVVIFSSHSNNSLHVSRECTRGIDSGRVLIPFRTEDILPSDAMKYLIGTPHWLDAITPPLEDHLSRLSRDIRVYLDGSQAGRPKT